MLCAAQCSRRFPTESTPDKANRNLYEKLGNESIKKVAVVDASFTKRMDKVAKSGVEAQT